ncbi:MAG: response regulator transcription factor [Alistipes sp.]|nr:response regulator transcription factor [Alistipes sp.]
MIKCIAVDDEPLALRQIKSYIERLPQLKLEALCSSAAEATDVLREGEMDLMFVDINMPDMSGVEFVRELQSPPMVIFTTAYSEYAVEGFRLDAVDYLLKPFSFADFERAVKKAASLYELKRLRDERQISSESNTEATADNGDYISIKADYKVSLVKYSDIIYIESVGEYVRLHLTNASPITTLFRLKNMETALPADRFMRVHRSYIVNLEHISAYARGRVYLDNDEDVPISANYRDTFREYVDKLHIAK